MATGSKVSCNSCQFSVEAWSDGNPYIVDSRGERQHFYHPDEETVLNRVRRFLAATQPGDLHENAGKMGNESDLLCLDCGRSCQLDPEVDELMCPECCGAKLRDYLELDGVACPKCRRGTLAMGGPEMVS